MSINSPHSTGDFIDYSKKTETQNKTNSEVSKKAPQLTPEQKAQKALEKKVINDKINKDTQEKTHKLGEKTFAEKFKNNLAQADSAEKILKELTVPASKEFKIQNLAMKQVDLLKTSVEGREKLWSLFVNSETGLVDFAGNAELERTVGLGEIAPKAQQYLKVNGVLVKQVQGLRTYYEKQNGTYAAIFTGDKVEAVKEGSPLAFASDGKDVRAVQLKLFQEQNPEIKLEEGEEVSKEEFLVLAPKEKRINKIDLTKYIESESAFDSSVLNALNTVQRNEALSAATLNENDNGGVALGLFQYHQRGELYPLYLFVKRENPQVLTQLSYNLINKFEGLNQKKNQRNPNYFNLDQNREELKSFGRLTENDQVKFKFLGAKNIISTSIGTLENNGVSDEVIKNTVADPKGLALILDIQNQMGNGGLKQTLQKAANNIVSTNSIQENLQVVAQSSVNILENKGVKDYIVKARKARGDEILAA